MTGNNNKNLQQLLKIIREDVDEYCDRIKKETDEAVNRELARTRKEIAGDVRRAYEIERSRLTERNNSGLSSRSAQQLEDIITYREKIAQSVFDKAKKKIKDFTQSPEYAEFLKGSAKAVTEKLGDSTKLLVRPEDKEAYAKMLGEFAKEIEADESIILGGIKGVSTARNMIADDTLDMRFEQQKISFYETSGLSVML